MESMMMRSAETPSNVATSLVKSFWNVVLEVEPAAPTTLISTASFNVTTLTTFVVGFAGEVGSEIGGGGGGGGGG